MGESIAPIRPSGQTQIPIWIGAAVVLGFLSIIGRRLSGADRLTDN